MQIGPFEIGRARAAQEPKAGPQRSRSGVVNLAGFLDELEYSPDLRGERGILTLERMRSSDGSVQEALGHITAPLLNAAWDFEPVTTQDDDLLVAEACRQAFFEWPTQPFQEYLDQALDFLVFGHQVFEKVWQVVDAPLTVEKPDADPTEVPDRQYLTFRRFAQMLPQTIYKWLLEAGEFEGVTQNVWRSDEAGYGEITLDASELVLYVHRRRGDDLRGRSLLRGAHKHWAMKELVEKIEVVALERHGVGVWVAYPSSAHANDDKVLDRTEEILEGIRAGARAYIVSNGPKAASSAAAQDGWLYEIVSPGGQMGGWFKDAKEYHRGEIKGSLLVRFAELGHGNVGARATGDTQSEVWRDALHSLARYISEVNDDPVRQFCEANFTGITRFPKLVAREIESKNLEEFANAHFRLVSAGAVEPDRAYRRYVRNVLGAPEEDDPDAIDEQRKAALNPEPDPDADEGDGPIEEE